MELRERWVKVDGVRTRYAEAGSGSPFVMIHGGGPGASWRGWRRNIEAFAQHFWVIAPDMIGYGETDKPAIGYTEPKIARHLGRFIEALGLEDVAIMGNSKGAYWAARTVCEDPKRFRKYVIVGSNTVPRAMGLERIITPGIKAIEAYDGTEEKLRAFLDAILFTSESDEFVRERNKMANVPGAAEMREDVARYMKALGKDSDLWQEFSLEQRLPKLTLPILIVWGADDNFAPVSQARELHGLLPGSTLQIIERAGHQCQTDNPEQFAAVVLDFLLDRTSATAGRQAPALARP
jgi:pimeloyl-ACP methyl ester carboxylesterase